jgi:hypothetical protein
VFVERHRCLSLFGAHSPAQSPSSLSGKGSNAAKAETPDAGPSVLPRGNWPSSRPFSSQPGSSGSGGYTQFGGKGKAAENVREGDRDRADA